MNKDVIFQSPMGHKVIMSQALRIPGATSKLESLCRRIEIVENSPLALKPKLHHSTFFLQSYLVSLMQEVKLAYSLETQNLRLLVK